MSQEPQLQHNPPQVVQNASLAMIIYVLYLVGFFTGITALVGVILAYVNRTNEPSAVVRSHFDYQISTFWWGLLWLTIGWITVWILVGYIVWLVWAIWALYRCIKGLSALNRNEAVQ